MPTNEEIRERIIAALKAKAPNPKCPLCQHTEWGVPAYYMSLAVSSNVNEIRLGGRILPLVPVNCANCGNTHLVNLFTLGFTAEDLPNLRFSEDVGK